MLNRDFTGSTNKGANKTRRDQEKAIKGTKHRAPKRTRKGNYNKAVEDAKAAFLMQTGYLEQRSNYDIISPVKDAKAAIKGEGTIGTGSPEFVNRYDKAVARTGQNKQYKGKLNLDNGGPEFVNKFDRTVKKWSKKDDPRPSAKSMAPSYRMTTSEVKKASKDDYAPMMDADAFGASWSKSDRYLDSPKGSKSRKRKKVANFAERNITAQAEVIGSKTNSSSKKKKRKKVAKGQMANHLRKNKTAYGALAGTVAAGTTLAAVNAIRKRRKRKKNEQKEG